MVSHNNEILTPLIKSLNHIHNWHISENNISKQLHSPSYK